MTTIIWFILTFSLIAFWTFRGIVALDPNLVKDLKVATWFSSKDPAKLFAYISLSVGLLIAFIGHDYNGIYQSYVQDFYANGVSELISIAITILVIDRLNDYRLKAQEKEKLILQLSSTDIGFATEASRLLNLHGWLTDGSVRGAYLHGTNLSRAMLDNADFQECNLIQSKFKFAYLNKANFTKANLQASDLSECHLLEANLTDAILANANLNRTLLIGAKLWGADFSKANLRAAHLFCADLTGAILWAADLTDALYDENTIWPDGFDYEEAGAIFVEQ